MIDGAREIEVTLHDGKSYDARVVGKDESNDVAVIQINAPADFAVSGHAGRIAASARSGSGSMPSAIPSAWNER